MTSDPGGKTSAARNWKSLFLGGAALLTVATASFLAVVESAGSKADVKRPLQQRAGAADRSPVHLAKAAAIQAPSGRAAPPSLQRETRRQPPAPSIGSGGAGEIDAQRDPLTEHLYLSSLAVGLRSAPGGRWAKQRAAELVESLVEVTNGDTLMALLTRAGADSKEAHRAIEALSAEYDPRRLQPGQEIQLAFRGDESGALSVEWLRLQPDPELEIHVQREAEGYAALTVERPLAIQEHYARGEISSSLFAAGAAANVPNRILVEAIRAMSFDVDFQRDIQPGTSYEFFYEALNDDSGTTVKSGDLLYVALGLGERDRAFYRFESKDGTLDFYDANGLSARRGLLRTPIDGARISSNFGMRRHPIKGYNRMHQGIDFAAPTGTPIYAAGDGVVEKAGRNGGYGNYIRLRHGNGYQTAYAHLSRFEKGLRSGARVRQGEVIGYVGTTGASTGPHLHYEVLVDGRQVNPASIKLPTGHQLAGAELESFEKLVREIDRKRIRERRVQLASAKSEKAAP